MGWQLQVATPHRPGASCAPRCGVASEPDCAIYPTGQAALRLLLAGGLSPALADSMKVSTVLKGLRSQHECGQFLLKSGDNLRAIVRREVPAKYGVYVVHAQRGRSRDLVYVGKAGTLLQNGEPREQTLPQRMVNRQNGLSRARFFSDRMGNEHLDHLHFEWFVTFERNGPRVPPFQIGRA